MGKKYSSIYEHNFVLLQLKHIQNLVFFLISYTVGDFP